MLIAHLRLDQLHLTYLVQEMYYMYHILIMLHLAANTLNIWVLLPQSYVNYDLPLFSSHNCSFLGLIAFLENHLENLWQGISNQGTKHIRQPKKCQTLQAKEQGLDTCNKAFFMKFVIDKREEISLNFEGYQSQADSKTEMWISSL